jgi:hypothetical protein
MLAGMVSIVAMLVHPLSRGLWLQVETLSKQFKEQGGASTMDPNPLRRWLVSTIIRRVLRPARLLKRRNQFERQRRQRAARHRVEYFHQIDDSYSHLTAQLLKSLLAR